MTYRTLALAALATAAFAGCGKNTQTIVAENPGDRNTPASAPIDPASLPPAIVASKIYRCKDNGVVYIDWLADNLSANLRSDKNGAAAMVKAPEAGRPMVAEGGYSLSGTATASSITVARPGKGSVACKA